MAEENQVQAAPVRVPVVPVIGLAVRVWQGDLTGAYGEIVDISTDGLSVVLVRDLHEFPALVADLEAN